MVEFVCFDLFLGLILVCLVGLNVLVVDLTCGVVIVDCLFWVLVGAYGFI